MIVRPIPMYLWLRWKLGHGEFKPYGRSNPAVRPEVGVGAKGQSPVPKKWWDELKRRLPKTTTPAPPLTPNLFALWNTLGYWTSWGWANGQFVDSAKARAGTVTAADLRPTLLKLKARGAKWVGVHDAVETRGMAVALRQACNELGLKLVLWDRYYTPDGAFFKADAAIDYWKPDAFAANIEDRADWSAFASGIRSAHRALPLACWTTFEGAGNTGNGDYDIALSKVWWANDWACITEAYVVDNPQATPEVLDWVARVKLGFPHVFPSVALYGGWTVERNAYLVRNFPAHSYYLAEYLPELP